VTAARPQPLGHDSPFVGMMGNVQAD
jgi:hypothetical protein